MKRCLSLLLCLLLLAGCGPEAASGPQPELEQVPAAEELALAVLDACGRDAAGLERTDQLLDEAGLSAYLANCYGLEEGAWTDCAIYRAGGAEAFEIAVARLAPDGDMDGALAGLNAYIRAREGDFTGYAPEQAELVHQSLAGGGEAALADGSQQVRFVGLFICENPSEARSAFLRRLDPEAVGPAAEPSAEPSKPAAPTESSTAPGSSGPAAAEPSAAVEDPVTTESPAASGEPAVSSEPPPEETTPASEPPASDTPAPAGAVTYPGRTDFLPPGIDDMTIYDSSAILAAWESGNDSALSDRDREVYDVCCKVMSEMIRDEMSDYDKELTVYRWLTDNAVYDWDHSDPLAEMDPASYTPYGVLVNGKGVCLGFATTFQLFMDLCGVECITVVGAAHKSASDHAWNMVRLNGEWYCADATWDLNYSRFKYFNVTSDHMASTDHQWDYNNVPEATARDGGKS